ncbi:MULTISPECIES: hypothetical protein [Paenibacillus]|uniref:Uncharacterized protein n=1 Tax=Paenibacillus naphthalenovorans TaxID=162209 RepID=A0A0U2KY43_9BACL|nr:MULTISPECIES: hypothetical protein [Paenibacillus]ALS21810.1 hypothetical protein IJ22_14340 [Paenibacillus naphthalenovorans]NTZ16550.1 hypothetical protein [Paenibacillus sp. JMULE4]GCL71539.1 hypothetical protein PN4B1_14440 [Paenibacillus naphthalenovorans]
MEGNVVNVSLILLNIVIFILIMRYRRRRLAKQAEKARRLQSLIGQISVEANNENVQELINELQETYALFRNPKNGGIVRSTFESILASDKVDLELKHELRRILTKSGVKDLKEVQA